MFLIGMNVAAYINRFEMFGFLPGYFHCRIPQAGLSSGLFYIYII
jgi:hypothetical protein